MTTKLDAVADYHSVRERIVGERISNYKESVYSLFFVTALSGSTYLIFGYMPWPTMLVCAIPLLDGISRTIEGMYVCNDLQARARELEQRIIEEDKK